jgi:hypothetical protein
LDIIEEDGMTGKNLRSIVSEVNLRAKTHPIGGLQEIRKDLKGLQRLSAQNIFTNNKKTTSRKWAFHYGGLTELQFNIGFERVGGVDKVRHGVAFMLKTSQTLPKIKPLIRKVKLFNKFMQLHSKEYADMRMWHYRGEEPRSADDIPTLISEDLIDEAKRGAAKFFIFLGKRQPLGQLDYKLLLNDFDRLLPLYKYIESSGSLSEKVLPEQYARKLKGSEYQSSKVNRETDRLSRPSNPDPV